MYTHTFPLIHESEGFTWRAAGRVTSSDALLPHDTRRGRAWGQLAPRRAIGALTMEQDNNNNNNNINKTDNNDNNKGGLALEEDQAGAHDRAAFLLL